MERDDCAFKVQSTTLNRSFSFFLFRGLAIKGFLWYQGEANSHNKKRYSYFPSLSMPSGSTMPAPSRPLYPPGDRSLLVTGRPTLRRLLDLSSWRLTETTSLNLGSHPCVGTRRPIPEQYPTQCCQGSSWQFQLTQGTQDITRPTQSGDSIHAINRWKSYSSDVTKTTFDKKLGFFLHLMMLI